MEGMLDHVNHGTPFLLYPRFIQLFLDDVMDGIDKPKNFIPAHPIPFKIFTFMKKDSPQFSGTITPLTQPMMEVVLSFREGEHHEDMPTEELHLDSDKTVTQQHEEDTVVQSTGGFMPENQSTGGSIPQNQGADDYVAESTGEPEPSQGADGSQSTAPV